MRLEHFLRYLSNQYRELFETIRYFQGLLTSCRSLSPTWNFPDTVIKAALLAVLKHEARRNHDELLYFSTHISSTLFLSYYPTTRALNTGMGTREWQTIWEDKEVLAAEVSSSDRDAWATTNALRLSAAFRHYSQASLRRREWVPEAQNCQTDLDPALCNYGASHVIKNT